MKRFHNILAVVGDAKGTDEVIDRASQLAKRNNAALTLIEVIEDVYVSSDIIAERERALAGLLIPIRALGVEAHSVVRRGKIFFEVIQQVLGQKNDLVLMAAEAPGGFRDLLFGSNSLHLMRKCPCPVWVLKPGEAKQFRRILAAIDVHPHTPHENAITTDILKLATSLANLEDADLHVVHAWDVTGNDAYTLQSEVPDTVRTEILKRHVSQTEDAVTEILKPFLETFGDIQTHIERGEAWQAITAVEKAHNIDLIVMGTIDRPGIPGFFIGTTAETVLRQVNCSVLTIKPSQFVSPVTLEGKIAYA